MSEHTPLEEARRDVLELIDGHLSNPKRIARVRVQTEPVVDALIAEAVKPLNEALIAIHMADDPVPSSRGWTVNDYVAFVRRRARDARVDLPAEARTTTEDSKG